MVVVEIDVVEVFAELVFAFDEVIADDAEFVAGIELDVLAVDGEFAVVGAGLDFAIVDAWVAVVGVFVAVGAGEFDGLVGASVDGKEAASKRKRHVFGVIVVISDAEAGEGIENLAREGLGDDGLGWGEDKFVDDDVGAKTEQGDEEQNYDRNERVVLFWLRLICGLLILVALRLRQDGSVVVACVVVWLHVYVWPFICDNDNAFWRFSQGY